jgi:predicted ATPase/class 3 adenylate cyclase/GAF domain-containing protein/tRNA A-37 threonylcarbamoyl transferase component Bud32
MLTLPNYQISTQIYESANSVVYRGVRNEDNQQVILKILKEDYPTPEELTRYRQEYDITRRLADLEGVVNAYRLEKHQNTLVMCLEDFGGKSLKMWLDDQHTFTFDELLTFAIQATEILGQIHEQNVIHKDINPSNLIWNPNSKVLKIIDFGISTQLPKQHLRLKNPEVLEGTLAYMSPEQTGRMNRALDYRTDFYSLGATFYELFTRFVPFEPSEAMELVHYHIAKQPTPPDQINPDLPPTISNIIMKLLEKTAEARYQSAWGIKADLQECQLQLANNDTIEPFALAQKDLSEHFQIPQKLYGREPEIDTLRAAFERVASGTAEVMLVGGYSGIGKSVLVKEIYKSLTEKQGYFISGKFDQFQRNIPYSAVVNAFKELVQQLLTENEQLLSLWKEKLLTALEPNGQVIIDVIPEIEWIIGAQPAVPQLGPTESKNRFNLVFQNFMRVFFQPKHPLVMFLDDLQWVDSATLKLLELVTTDKDNTAFFLIGAYRDNEVSPTHHLVTTLDKLRSENVTINQITLKPLGFEQINQLIAESLHHDIEAVSALTDLVRRKTAGNPFFVNQFLRTLYEEDLLHFVSPTTDKKGQWEWDIAQIEAMNITDNVVDLMISKLKKLPSSAQHLLRLAACVGNHFQLEILSVIYDNSISETFQHLMLVLTEGLILPKSEPEMIGTDIHKSQFIIPQLQFSHDRVQQAAYALIDDEQKQAVHLQIGRLLLDKTPADTLEEKVFEIVRQFNQSLELLNNFREQVKIAQLNLMAGQKAKTATAYDAAAKYFKQGLKCLSKESWQNTYHLTLALYVNLVEIAYLNGDFEQMNEWAEIVLQQAKTELDKIRIYEIKIQAFVAQGQLLEAVQIALTTLKLLGIHFPKKPNALDIYWISKKTQFIIGHRKIEDLIHLKEMTDPVKRAIMRILMSVHAAIYVGVPELIFFEICTRVILSIKDGNTPESAHAYADYGILLCRFMGKIELGYRFGQLGLNLLERLNAKEIKAKTLTVFNGTIRYWKEHVKNSLAPLLEAYQTGLETGDLEYAAIAINVYCSYLYLLGKPLTEVAQQMVKYSAALEQLNQTIIWQWNEVFRQAVLSLMGKTNNPVILKGEAYDEDKMLPLHQQKNDKTALCYLYFNKLVNSYLLHQNSAAVEYYEMSLNDLENSAMLIVPHCHFYGCLAKLGIYPNVSQSEQQQIWKQIKANQKQMKIWATHAPMNFQHKYDLVEAETASKILGKFEKAIKCYERSIKGAMKNGYIQEKALAYELAAEFYLAQGMEPFAQSYIKEAHYHYQQWGALAKVEELEIRYPQFMAPKTDRAMPTNATLLATRMAPSSSKNIQYLDLKSLMKAAQTLSGEMVLSRLLDKMMHIVIENAGAERGFLLLPKQDSWFIEAEGHINNNEVLVLQSLAIETNERLPAKMIRYVARTQNTVILHDATREGSFTRAPYVVKQRPKSILCVPLLNQRQLSGILYLENNLTTGAFTQERIEVLNLLSSQIAISIENARLYTSITRFLPSEFLKLLDKKNIIEVQLGDQVEKEMSILFADIRGFTALSEKMTPQENFDFINAYLSTMAPIIAQHQGFIDKYIGDAIMALFPTGANEAVSAACSMLRKLADYNQTRQKSGLEPIAIGIGVNTGLLMLGTVGGENRMDGTVISDAVNLASRIEGMTKMYGVALLISEETYKHLNAVSQEAKRAVSLFRSIDRVIVTGKSEPVTVYEVFDADAPELAELKMKTRDDFENGLVYYRQKGFTEAIRCFEQVLCIYPDDKAAQIYRSRCLHWQKVGVPDDWEGVETLDSK